MSIKIWKIDDKHNLMNQKSKAHIVYVKINRMNDRKKSKDIYIYNAYTSIMANDILPILPKIMSYSNLE